MAKQLAKWLYEAGIGENRAVLVEDDTIVEVAIEPDEPGLRVGLVSDARLIERFANHAIVTLAGHEAIVEPVPRQWTDGQVVRVEIVREALPERGVRKRARARMVDALPRAAPTLLDRLGDDAVVLDRHGPDLLETFGWSELLAEAAGAPIAFGMGALHIEPTRAMTLIDVDGWGEVDALCTVSASAAAVAIRRLGLAGAIGIDFPTASRDARAAAARAFDAVLPPPFERTAINGFGLMQIIRPRARRSMIELVRGDARAWARMLLRRAERSGLIGASTMVAHPSVVAVLHTRPDWCDQLARALGGAVGLRADPTLVMDDGHVERA